MQVKADGGDQIVGHPQYQAPYKGRHPFRIHIAAEDSVWEVAVTSHRRGYEPAASHSLSSRHQVSDVDRVGLGRSRAAPGGPSRP
jgi:hypothetical protein